MKAKLFIFTLVFSLVIFVGCSPKMCITITEDSNVNFSFKSGTSDSLNKTLYSLTGLASGSELYDKTLIKENLKLAGFDSSVVEVTNQSNISIETSSKQLAKIAPELSSLIIQDKSKPQELKIKISPKKIRDVLSVFPEETTSYTELLMAPIFTDEKMTTDEYVELLSLVYGDKIAKETKDSVFGIEISVPKKIKYVTTNNFQNVKNETLNGKAKIEIPLVDFLCLQSEAEIVLNW